MEKICVVTNVVEGACEGNCAAAHTVEEIVKLQDAWRILSGSHTFRSGLVPRLSTFQEHQQVNPLSIVNSTNSTTHALAATPLVSVLVWIPSEPYSRTTGEGSSVLFATPHGDHGSLWTDNVIFFFVAKGAKRMQWNLSTSNLGGKIEFCLKTEPSEHTTTLHRSSLCLVLPRF